MKRALAALLLFLTTPAIRAAAGQPDFETDILPLLRTHCFACHGAANPQAGLDLRTRESILKGGRSGPAIHPGSADRSLLIEKLVSRSMPPAGPKLSAPQVELIRRWVDQQHAAPKLVTEKDVLPIFQMRCVVCHGKRRQEGGLDLRFQAARLKGGKSGPALIPGKPEQSLLLKRILDGQMPPPKKLVEFFVRPPASEEVETLRQWIAGGALPAPPDAPEPREDPLVKPQDRLFWSFQPPKRPAVPSVRHADLVRNPVDAFLLAKLEAKGLSYAPEAGKLALMRRAYFDAIGLPPAPDEVEAYLADKRPDAYEQLVDRLLASPRYGERWAKFWLDAAGYSDSEGIIDEDLIRPNAWRYRDYVIRSLNEDKPYDRFLTEQIAGDELVRYHNGQDADPATIETVTATGFLRMVPDGTYSPANGSIAERMNVIADEMEVLGSSVMGLTIGCARCHNHKYDPLPQRDYYRLSATLQSAYDPYDWVKPTERHLDIAPADERREIEAFNSPLEKEIRRLEDTLAAKAKPLREKLLEERLAKLPEGIRADLRQIAATPEDQRTVTQKYLAERFEETLEITDQALDAKFPEFRAEAGPLRKSIAETKKKLKPKPQIRALYEMGGEPSPAYLLRRGDAQQIGEAVRPGVPSVIRAGLADYRVEPPWPGSSGRRLGLARWLTQPNHPLTSRVLVNRIWMRHFGRGIVASPANFGRLGTPPSHPELLDWLATEFVRRGWSIKAIHRLLMTSTAYRQTSAVTPDLQKADPEDILLSRMPLRRLDAEQLHDAILSVSQELDLRAFGPPVSVEVKPAGEVLDQGTPKQGWRRAIYALQRRTTPVTLLEAFDLPPMSPNCIQRAYSTVSIQALQMTNSAFIRDRARYLAGRLLDADPENSQRQIERLYLRALARRPAADETQAALRDLASLERHWASHLQNEKSAAPRQGTARWYALADLCHAILISADFTYVD
jgi:hypothetical protein